MIWFLLIYFGVYGGLHVFFYFHMRPALPKRRWVRLSLIAFLALMVVAPMLVRAMGRAGWGRPSYPFTLVSFIWMAVLFWAFVLFLLADVWRGLVWLVGRRVRAARRLQLSTRTVALVSAVLILAATCWGVYEALDVQVRHVTVTTPHLPPGSKPIRIVQVSDMHLGPLVGEGRLRTMLDLVREAKPDIFVSTGDLVDGGPEYVDALAPMLAEIDAPLGKFAVTGNHEFYQGLDHALGFHQKAGLEVLRGRAVVVDGRLVIAGVDDPAGRRTNTPMFIDEDKILPSGSNRKAVVLLKHQPWVRPESVGRFDLQLSGHIHGGQIFPFGLIVRLVYPNTPGLHRLDNGASLYVSPGTGTWGPPLRLFTPPEVTVITLSPSE
jgi:uncharacterized protein